MIQGDNSGEANQWAQAHFLFGQGILAADLEKVHQIGERVARSYGLELVDVELTGGAGKQGRNLRVTIERREAVRGKGAAGGEDVQAGVTLEDCANVSREMSTILDVEDAVGGGEYMLEVSSPGLDRKLKSQEDFARFVGNLVKVMTREPIGVTEKSKGNRHFEGRLQGFAEGTLTLDVTEATSRKGRRSAGDKKTVEIAYENIERANLVPEI
jgi:ribosome maturation factor RimP